LTSKFRFLIHCTTLYSSLRYSFFIQITSLLRNFKIRINFFIFPPLYHFPNHDWTEKSAYTMEPDNIGLEFSDFLSDSKCRSEITERIHESHKSKHFRPSSFCYIPPKNLDFVPLLSESPSNRLYVCLDSTEESRIIAREKDFLRTTW